MQSGRASKTAEHNALFRALEARRPPRDRVVNDALAVAFLSLPYRAIARSARWRLCRDTTTRFIDRRYPGVRPTVLARTRVIDELIEGVVATTPQVAILGAGLDTRAWRLPCLDAVTVFEVDHPDTQHRKRRLLRRVDLDCARVRFVPSDFNLNRLGAAMTETGADPALPTLFLWEGTTNYLSAEAVDATMRWCAQAAPGSHLIFTYITADVLIDPARYVGAEHVLAAVRRAKEPMTFGLDPDALDTYLAQRGLDLVSDVGAAELRARCYGVASSAMRGHEFYRLAHAHIGRRAQRDSLRMAHESPIAAVDPSLGSA